MGLNARWTPTEQSLIGEEVVIYSRDSEGEVDANSFTDAVLLDLRFTMFGDKLAIVQHIGEDGTRHQNLYSLATRKHYASYKFPYWFFCMPDEELPQYETKFCQPVT